MTQATASLGVARRTVRELGLGLITLGVVILLFVAYQLFGTNLAAAHAQTSLRHSFEAQVRNPDVPALATAPSGDQVVLPATPGSGAIDHLVIPKIGLDRYVVDGTGETDLQKGPGHYLGTPYPGEVGDVAIAGHRTTYGAPFYRADRLTVGDPIYLTDTSGHTFLYRVDQPSFAVAPTDVSVIGPTPDATLTLTTCNPPLSATSRLIVKARLDGTPAATSASQALHAAATNPAKVLVRAATDLNGGASSALAPAIGWGSAALVVWVVTRLAARRVRRLVSAAVLVGGALVACIPLWPCFESVVRLLPQSI